MARSPFTLAASVTSALPRVGVVSVGTLTETTGGRYDTAVVELDDGRRVVVRAPSDAAAADDLQNQARALRALTPGVRALLPFRVPELLGETGLGDARALVVDLLPGYRVDAVNLPPGPGAASSIGAALAAVHALPPSIVRATAGLPVQTPGQVRDEVVRLLDRVEATRRVPLSLIGRWRRAVSTDALWRFESTVVLGGAAADDFLLEDATGGPRVVGVLEWHGLALGDPAIDLRWMASAPRAADDVYAAYAADARRAPDGALRIRARFYAELEFAKWLVHGHEAGSDDVVDDAVGLLDALADGVRDDDLVTGAVIDVDDAIALLDRVPDAGGAVADTSMQTDAYDPAMLSLFLAAEEPTDEHADSESGQLDAASEAVDDPPVYVAGTRSVGADDDLSTAPIDISAMHSGSGHDAADDQADSDRSAEAALRRWTAEQS